MKNRFSIAALLAASIVMLLLLSNLANGQSWMKLLPEESRANPSFYDCQKAFYDHFNDVEQKNYTELKKFKRWEWIMQNRVDENGHIPSSTLLDEWSKLSTERRSKSTNGNWHSLGPAYTPFWKQNGAKSGSGRLDCVEFHPHNNNIMWAGSHSGGLWKTTDGGITWNTTTDNLISIGISDVVVNPQNPDILYIGTGDRDGFSTNSIGVLKSLDGGQTWTTTGMMHDLDQGIVINELLMNPNNPMELIAATTQGIFKTIDEGASWDVSNNGNFIDIEYNPGTPSIVYATTYSSGSGARIYRSMDGGDSFTLLIGTGINMYQIRRIALAVSPARDSTLYALCCKESATTELVGIYRSDDCGDSWYETVSGTDINLLGRSEYGADVASQGWYVLSLAVSPVNIDEVYTGSINIWKSNDGGVNWEILTHETPGILPGVDYTWVDHHELRFNQQTNIIYSANDGGICKSSNNGADWIDLSDGLSITQFYRIGLSNSDENIVVGGCQDQFGFMLNNGSWEGLYTGEAGDHMVDPIDPDIIYGTGYGGGVLRSRNGGIYYNRINPNGVNNSIWLPPFVMNPHNSNTLYLAIDKVYISYNQGDDWEVNSPSLSAYGIKRMDVAYSDTTHIYALCSNEIWKTSDAGANWTGISSGLPAGTFNEIEVSQDDPNTLWITYAAYTQGQKVYRSNDGGDTWINVSDNLPNIWMNGMVHQRGSNNGIYCATEMGVFYTNDYLNEWVDFSNGMPNVIVPEMEIHYPSGKIRAGTFGRGLWESDLYTQSNNISDDILVSPLTVSPNPSHGTINVKITFAQKADFKVRILNSIGQQIYIKNHHTKSLHEVVDLSKEKAGIYNVIVETQNQLVAKKIIVF